MRSSLLLLLALLTGCVSYCDGQAVLAAAGAGDLAAIHELGELGDPRVPASWAQTPRLQQGFDTLIPFLDHEDPFVRLTALEGLRTLSQRAPARHRDLYPDLFDGSLSDPEPKIRWRAAWALGRLERSRPGLTRALGDPEPRVAERAAWALGQAKDAQGVEALVDALEREEPAVRKGAQRALARITGESHETPAQWKAWWAQQRDR